MLKKLYESRKFLEKKPSSLPVVQEENKDLEEDQESSSGSSENNHLPNLNMSSSSSSQSSSKSQKRPMPTQDLIFVRKTDLEEQKKVVSS